MNTNHIRWVHGIDFSGAKDAGRKIWIATGLIQGKELQITDCRPAKELPESERELRECLSALIEFVSGQREAIFGMDFPFSLPAAHIEQKTWKDFILSFRKRFPDPERFRRICLEKGNQHELKRITDKEQRTPFSPYNVRLFKQTYYGIGYIIEPLLQEGQACFLPMEEPLPGKPWVIEICPAVTLKQGNLYTPYKKRPSGFNHRSMILKTLVEIGNLGIPQHLQTEILDNAAGDALDSIVAAFATFRNLPNLLSSLVLENPIYNLEGFVYA
ncbi:MAG: hypothetical protein ACE144_09345 [Thermodesulfobacteriota bacterium]